MIKNQLENNQTIHKDEQKWTIEAEASLLSFKLDEVWAYRDLLLLIVRRDFVSFYKQTILGPIWFFIQPIFTTITFTFIFGKLADLKTDNLPEPLFYMAGITAWGYFAECLNKTSNTFRDNAAIFGKVYFPRLIIPLSTIISNLIRFGIQVFLFIIFIGYYYFFSDQVVQPNWAIFLFPILIILMAVLGMGIGMIISAMTTKYRDLSFLVSFGVQLLMYGTTVIVPLSEAKKTAPAYSWILEYNPMTSIIETFRYGFLGRGSFDWENLGYTTLISFTLLFIGIAVFNKVERDFVDTV